MIQTAYRQKLSRNEAKLMKDTKENRAIVVQKYMKGYLHGRKKAEGLR